MEKTNNLQPANQVSTAKHNIAIVLLCFCILGLATGWFRQWKENRQVKKELSTANVAVKTAVKAIKRSIDDNGNEHIEFRADENKITRQTAVFARTLDTVASQIGGGVKKNDITEFTKVAISVSDKDLKAVATIDTQTKRPVFTYNDNLFTLGYSPGLTPDSPGIFTKVGVDLNLSHVNYRKRAWILGGLKSYTNIYANDKRVKFKGADHLLIEQTEPAFGLRIRGAASYNTSTSTLSAGPEVAFDFGRNQIRANYYYNTNAGTWRPTFTLTRDFIRF
jgi:hypothetical protein